jgi:NDP-sugar pyrophosphorylase family protein
MPVHFPTSYWSDRWATRNGKRSDLRAAILAAGLGSRLDPLTARLLPKPLFPLGGKVAIAEVWVRRMVESGITDVTLNLCVLAGAIKRYFGDGAKFGADVRFAEEQVPTGTLGGVCKQVLGREARRVRPHEPLASIPASGGSTVIAPSGDIVTNFGAAELGEMYDIHRKSGAAVTMVVTPIPADRRKDFGTVVMRAGKRRKGRTAAGEVESFVEKDPNSPSLLSNASIYMIEVELLRELDQYRTEAKLDVADPFYDFGKHAFPAMLGSLPHGRLARRYPIWAMQYDGPWFDVGNKRDYLLVNQHVLDGKIHVPLAYQQFPWGYMGTGVSIDFSKVEIHPPVVIGSNCVVEAGAVLGPYAVIGEGWVVENGAQIRNSVLWERYPYFPDRKHEVSIHDRLLVDRHQVRAGATVATSIITGGTITGEVIEKTVEVLEDGRHSITPLDTVPQGARP